VIKKTGRDKRDPTSHRSDNQASRHWQEYGKKHKPANRRRKKARRLMEKAGRVKPKDGKEVDHKYANAKGKLTVMSRSANRRKG
jgi:hypothetical protein